MTATRDNGEGRVDCPTCGIVLAVFNRERTLLYAARRAAVLVPVGAAHVELICLPCGELRTIRGKRLARVVLQRGSTEGVS